MKKNQTFVCGTLYHVYVSALKSIYYQRMGVTTLLIVNDHTPGINDLAYKLVKNDFFNHLLVVPFVEISKSMREKEPFFKRAFFRNTLSIEYVEMKSSIKEYSDFIKSSDINLFYNLGLSNTYFILRYGHCFFRQLEDGYRNYNPRVGWLKILKRKYILNTVIGEGRDKEIKTIEVQYPDKLPKSVKDKGVKLNLSKLQNNLMEFETHELLSIFLNNYSLNTGYGKNLILITQPLSEDGRITETEKINLYQEIIEKFGNGYTIYIKTHPRELTDYKASLNIDFVEIPRSFPLELLNFFENIRFDLGITVFSSALNNLTCIENKIFLGEHIILTKKNKNIDYEYSANYLSEAG
jgi:hypothetical protein